MPNRRFVTGVIAGAGAALLLATAALIATAAPTQAQEGAVRLPGDDNVRPWGQGATPVYEGWYEHPDGEGYVISFGYLNRNGEEVLEIPVGEANRFEPDSLDGIQPTKLLPRRHYGVFTVTVPSREDEVTWTLDFRGERYEIPGRASNINYKIDAMYAPATGLTPPRLWFDLEGEEGQGPHGIRAEPRTVAVGEPLELVAYTADDTWDGEPPSEGLEELEPHEVTLRWFKFSGPGEVTFDEQELPVEPRDGPARTSTAATFSEPGEYVLYVRANNEDVVGSGMEQCCWTNGYVSVTVTP